MNPILLALALSSAVLAFPPALAAGPGRAELAEQSRQRLAAMRGALGLDENHSFQLKNINQDALGQTHVRFSQFYRGLRVWGGEAISHVAADGAELPLTSALRRDIQLDVRPKLSAAAALAAAKADFAPRPGFAYGPTAELVVYPETVSEVLPGRAHLAPGKLNAEDFGTRTTGYRLAYYVHAELESPGDTRHTDYLIDANTGAVIEKWDSLHTSSAAGTGLSQYSGTVGLDTNSVAGGYEMRDMTRPAGNGNAVYNLNHSTEGIGAIYLDPDNAWGDGANYKESPEPTASANGQTAAVDAAFGLQASWDMYKNVFGRDGIDGLGTSVYARVHYDYAYDNAFYSDYCMCITYGDGTKLQTLTALDVAAHEFSHGVCSTTAGLIYNKESGGLNEANSDIMGAMAEFYARGAGGRGGAIPDAGGNWTQGEQITTPAYPLKMRFLYKPSKDGKSADAWSPALQNLDVHYSSGPMNRAFYFLSQGATQSGETSTPYLPNGMAGIGNNKAAKIWFLALTGYMTSSTDYKGARVALIQAARKLFQVSGPEEIAVWNAFAGINVGQPWSGADMPPAVTLGKSGDKGTITFDATAVDDKGVVKVEFFFDKVLVGTKTAPPYTLDFNTAMEDDGPHTMVARATDTADLFTDQPLPFTLNNGQLVKNGSFEKGYGVGWSNTPGMQIGAVLDQTPFDGVKMAKFCGMGSQKSVALYQSIAIPAQASSAGLSFALHVETKETSGASHDTFAVQLRDPSSGSVLNTLASYSNLNAAAGYKVYNFDVAAYKGRTIQLYFRCDEDSALATGFVLDKVNLNVAGGGGVDLPPTITVSEAGGKGTIRFSADASDDKGVAKVEFYVDGGQPRGTVASPPYEMAFDSTRLSDGGHVLTGRAYDTANQMAESGPVPFSVDNGVVDNFPPTISVGESGGSGTIRFFADAKDDVGVVKVEFYVDGGDKPLGAVGAPPYEMAFDSTKLGNGRHTLVGKAYDASGKTGSSEPVFFSIDNGGGPGGELLLNGGFEQGADGWSGSGRIGAFPAQPAYEGQQCAWLGGKGAANTAEIYQAVSIPATAKSAVLSYALHVDSAEKSTWLRYDTAAVQVRNGAGTSVLRTLASYSNLDKSTGYAVKSFDLSAYKGQTVQIYFKGAEDFNYQTSFVFDKVSLAVQ